MESSILLCDLFITSIVAAVYVPTGAGERVHRDRPTHGLAYHVTGEMAYCFSDGTRLHAGPGELLYLPQGSDYNVEIAEPGDCYAINFRLATEPNAPPLSMEMRQPERVLLLFRDAVQHRRRRGTAWQEHCMADLYRILCEAKEQAAAPYASERSRQLLQTALDYIAAHDTEERLPVEDLARVCGISQVYLRRLFREALGQTPVEYIRDRRLHYARELLSLGEYTVAEVCAQCGFGDVSYFTRCYGKKYGITPGRQK